MNPNLAELQEQLETVKNDFFNCQNKLLEAALAFGVSPQNGEKIASLPELESLLATVKKAEEERNRATVVRQQALTVLERVLTIFHRDNNSFQPLLQCQETADKLRRQISESVEVKADPESEALAEGSHAFSQVLRLIEGADELDDDRLTELQDAVAVSFERTLATAALRGKLTFGTKSMPEASTSAPVIENVPKKLEKKETEKAIAPPPVAPPVVPQTIDDSESPPWEVSEEEPTAPGMVEPPVLEPSVVPPPVLEPPVVEPPVVSAEAMS